MLWLVLDESCYLGIFEIVDYESVLSISKFNIADAVWRKES